MLQSAAPCQVARKPVQMRETSQRMNSERQWRRWGDKAHLAGMLASGASQPPRPASARRAVLEAQRLRLQRLRLACAGYCFFFTVTGALWWEGQLNFNLIALISLIAVGFLMCFLFTALILSGKNLALRDPSMTFVQTLTLILIVLAMAWSGRTVVAQNAAALGLVVGVLFGMFRLGARGLSILAAIAFAGFSFVVLRHTDVQGIDRNTNFVRLVIVGGTLIWTTVFASYVGQLRKRLGARNAELRGALIELEKLARRDGLTGIYNRREIFRQLGEALEEGLRLGAPVSISLFDLDGFKRINDNYGHALGDAALCEFVRRVKATARSIDRLGRVAEGAGFGRYGGEEFLLIMPVTALKGAVDAAERIRRAVSAAPFVLNGKELTVTVSQGVAEAGRKEPIDRLLARADRALYRAKHEGRDCVASAEPSTDSGLIREGPMFFGMPRSDKP